jgi:hypothetical protein
MTTDNDAIAENKTFDIIVNGKCMNCSNAGLPKHNCPFKIDLDHDYVFFCNCCDSCCHECILII